MIDKREQILTRLFEILMSLTTGTSPVAKTAVRNRSLMKNEARPGLAILDGDERARASLDRKFGRSVGFTPQIMIMSPQIYILMDERRTDNEEIGPDVNAIRIAVLSAIASDAELQSLYGSNGSIMLNATITDLKSGGYLQGQMYLDFGIAYPMIP